jgi:hypothetical protein
MRGNINHGQTKFSKMLGHQIKNGRKQIIDENNNNNC